MVEIKKLYTFEGPNGPATLRDLLQNRQQLIVYHFMFDPSWDEGCRSCSHFPDNFAGSLIHRDGDRIFHTYSTYQRGPDMVLNTYNFLDKSLN